MTAKQLPATLLLTAMLATAATAQSAPTESLPAPAIKYPNPATSSSTDEQGLNPLAYEGENSRTGWNKDGTVGMGRPSGERPTVPLDTPPPPESRLPQGNPVPPTIDSDGGGTGVPQR